MLSLHCRFIYIQRCLQLRTACHMKFSTVRHPNHTRACALCDMSMSTLLFGCTCRPPAMRTLQQHLAEGAAASGSGPTFSLAYDSSSKPGRIAAAGKPMPPGAEFVSKAASKNAKKRANKKAKAAGGADGDGEEDGEQQEQAARSSSNSNSQAAAVEAATQQVGVLL